MSANCGRQKLGKQEGPFFPIMQREKSNGKSVKLVKDKLFVNDIEYKFTPQEQQRLPQMPKNISSYSQPSAPSGPPYQTWQQPQQPGYSTQQSPQRPWYPPPPPPQQHYSYQWIPQPQPPHNTPQRMVQPPQQLPHQPPAVPQPQQFQQQSQVSELRPLPQRWPQPQSRQSGPPSVQNKSKSV